MVEWIQASSSSQNDKDQLPSVSDYTSEEEEEEKFSSLTSKSSINSKETKLSGNNDNDEEDSESDIVAVNKFQALNTID